VNVRIIWHGSIVIPNRLVVETTSAALGSCFPCEDRITLVLSQVSDVNVLCCDPGLAVPAQACVPHGRAAAILQAGQRISRQLRVVLVQVAVFGPGVSAGAEGQVSHVRTAQTWSLL
jgi:hypothetical protein